MNQKESNKKKLLKALLNGDKEALKGMKNQNIENCRGKVIFSTENENHKWEIIAPCLGWIGDKIRILTNEEYEALLLKYDFSQVIELSLEIRKQTLNSLRNPIT